ncbi:MAG: hypothetical protein JW712_03440 [Dehalococcoidales bacterium]|nr:hypothetical protein [Dehalococcoidales bacterium]
MNLRDSAKRKGHITQDYFQNLIDILQTIRSDYQQSREQLETIYTEFKAKEARTLNRLNSAQISLYQTPQQRYESRGNCIKVGFLGRFELFIDNQRVEHWSSAKAKSVCKFLIAQRGKPTSKELLMETLWSGSSPESAGMNLRTAVHTLRRILDSCSPPGQKFPYIQFWEGSYFVNPEVELITDDDAFEQHWTTGRKLEREGEQEAAVSEYAVAEKLYNGDYLEDDRYEEWTFLRREALKDMYLAILGKLAANASRKKDHESCIEFCLKILSKDPCSEDSYRYLMQSYSELGQRNRALHWYSVCEKTITAELDTSPEERTVTLYNKLLNNE